MRNIEDYSFGTVRVDGKRYNKDLIVYPENIHSSWWRKEGHRLRIEDIAGVLEDPPEVLVVGRGASAQMVVDPEVVRELEARGVELVAEPTEKACASFNDLSREGKRVVAVLHLTC